MLSRKYTNINGIWESNDGDHFVYSDGDEVENRLLALLSKARDVSVASDELQYLISDWPSEYHFSPLRANLLTSFNLGISGDILEVGSGCGALTRVLGEKHPHSTVIAVEGSSRRAEITRIRCRDLSNVEICRDSFARFEPGGLFGCVTMIGVLEYSPSYFAGQDPVLEALQRARKLLHRNGVLVVAIENQLGLKYFNGCTEDHSGKPFTGIEDAYDPGTFRTFGRQHLLDKMYLAGFDNVECVYPFPDYKLPRLLLRKEAFAHSCFDISGLVGQYPSRDYTGNNKRLFEEAHTWEVILKNNLLADLANSFLFFCFVGDVGLADITDSWLGKVYSCPRKKQYLAETVFYEDGNGLRADKKLSFPQISPASKVITSIKHRLTGGRFIPGTPYSCNFTKQVRGQESSAKFIEYLRAWVDFFQQQKLAESTPDRMLLPGSLLDCLPSNIIVDSGNKLCLFDQEWEQTHMLEADFLLFRGVYRELSVNMDYLLKYTDLFAGNDEGGNAYGVLARIFMEFKYNLDETILDRFIVQEVEVQKEIIVYRESKENLHDILYSFFMQSRLPGISAGDLLVPGIASHYAHLQKTSDEQSRQLARISTELTSLKRGWSWKLGRMITSVPRGIKDLFLT